MGTHGAILSAAEVRFSDYGYNKTTMAEIADDCGMCVGNLYRYFKNKEAIAVASTERLLEAKLRAGISAAAGQEDALDALLEFLLTRLRIGHRHFSGTRHLFDMMGLVNTRHRKMLLDFEARVIDALADIIERGARAGKFCVRDVRRTAYDIHQATIRYNNPVNLKHNKLSLLEADLERLVALLYRGLALPC